MAVVTIGTTGAVWGLTAESGIIVQTVDAKVTRDKNEVRNETGEIALVSYYNPIQKYTVNGVVIGTAGWASVSPGFSTALVNTNTLNGVTQGGVYVDDVDVPKANVDFKKITANCTQYPLIS